LRWYWLLALGAIVALGATWYALSDRQPLYRATATIQIGRAIQEKNPEQNDLAITERLVPAYAELAKRDPVLVAVSETLGISLSPDEIRARLLITPVWSTQLVDIQVVDVDPTRAAAIANEIARQIALQSPNPTPEDANQTFIEQQLKDLQLKITDGQSRILTLQGDIAVMTTASEIADAQERLGTLQAQVDAWQTSYATLLASAEPSNTNIVEVVSNATAPSAPIASSDMLYYALAMVIGVGLAALMALALGLLNGVIQRAEDVEQITGNASVVTIPRYRVPRGHLPVVLAKPDSPATAAYRVLRNVLQANGLDRSKVSLVVTSSRSGEGKTTTVANLAVAVANTGRRVILVDANFRNPELGKLFGLSSAVGFSNLMMGDTLLDKALQRTRHPKLRVITSGSIPPNYADLLSSAPIGNIADTLATMADVVLYDTSAVVEEQEALLLAKSTTGVLVIAEARRVKAADLENTLELLRHSDVGFISVVLNKTRVRRLTTELLPWSRAARLEARARRHRSAANFFPSALSWMTSRRCTD
jgi:non-specific protein-tyrosine kinase